MSENRLIRVEDLEKIYQDRIDYFVEKGMETGDPDLRAIAGAVNGCLRIAKELVPTVEAEPVVHAHWENERRNSRNMWVANCPVCGSENEDERPHGVSEFHRYCHWCGARMDEEVR